MQIVATHSPVLTNANSNQFTVANSGKMFKILISGLYSRKFESIVRELVSNAYDAQAEAGTLSKPIQIGLPTPLREEFFVKDSGLGIPHEQMLNLYTVLGGSTKENSNLGVGKWGVGRMSPMSYTDTFTVTTVHEGKRAVYNVTLSEDGTPTLNTLMPPMASNDASGTQVSFPVNNFIDGRSFRDAVRRVSLGLEVQPQIVNDTSLVLEPLTKISENKNYTLYEQTGQLPYGIYARMGCVIYPINVNGTGIPAELISRVTPIFGRKAAVLNFEIGELEVTASREDLSYGKNEPTARTIAKKFEEIAEGFTATIQSEIDKCKTDLEVFFKANSLVNNFPQSQGISILSTVRYKGKFLTPGYKKSLVDISDDGTYNPDITNYYRYSGKTVKSRSKTTLYTYETNKDFEIAAYYQGGPKRLRYTASVIKAAVLSSYYKTGQLYVIRIPYDEVLQDYDYTAYNRVKEIAGEAAIHWLQDYPYKPAPRAVPVVRDVCGKDLKGKLYKVDSSFTGFYLVSNNNYTDSKDDLLAKTLVNFKLKTEKDFLVVGKSKLSLLKELPNCKPIAEAKQLITKETMKEIVEYVEKQELPNYQISSEIRFFGHLFKEIKDVLEQENYKGLTKDECAGLLRLCDISYVAPVNLSTTVKQRIEYFKSKYPLLNVIPSYNMGLEPCKQYIAAIDLLNSANV